MPTCLSSSPVGSGGSTAGPECVAWPVRREEGDVVRDSGASWPTPTLTHCASALPMTADLSDLPSSRHRARRPAHFRVFSGCCDGAAPPSTALLTSDSPSLAPLTSTPCNAVPLTQPSHTPVTWAHTLAFAILPPLPTVPSTMARSLVLSLQKVLSPLLIFLLCCSSSSAQSASSQTLYWQYTITNGTNVFGAWSVCASGNLTVGITAGNSNLLNRAALPVYNIQGQRVFTNAAGSTVQHIVALLGNDNANLAADDLLYVQAPHVDSNGLAYLLDSPIVFGNGVYQYANLTIWPQTKTESYAPEGISAGLQVSSTPYPACPVTGNLVWAFSYTQLGTANGQSFTVCTTGLLTTSQLTSIGGQAAYTVVSASGSRQVTIGSDLTGSGNTVAQTVTGVASSSVDGADDYILASAPFLTSNGVTLQLSSPAVYASGTSAASYVTVQLSGGSVLEKAGATAAQVTSSRGFSVLNSQTLPLCPATQSFSWCLYAQSALAVDQAASHAGVWNVTASGTFTTQLATQTGGNHPNGGAYTPLAQYYVLTSITGTRTQVSSLTGTTTSTIVGLSPISAAYQYLANNRIYTTFPWLDEYGLLYTLDSAIVHPGGSVSSNQINLYGPRPVEGSEDTAAFAIFTYAKYTPGTALPTCSATSTPTTSIMYTYTATAPGSLLQWSSCVSAVLTVAGPYPTVVAGRNAYSVLGATGTRTYTVNGVSTVQTIVGVSDVIGDHTVYDAAPYSIYEGGVAFVLSSNAIFPGVTSKYDVLYIGDPNNYGYTIETGYERTFTAGVVSSISVAPGTTAPTTCQANQGGSAAATLMFSWTYTVNSPATSSTFGTWQVCASGQVTVSNSLQYPSKNLAIPAYSVVGFTGTRVYTDSRGSTVQQVQSLLGNGNANLAADDLLYAWYPFIDTSGIAFYLDSPAIYSDGSYQYNNVTLWPLSYRNTVESYSPAPQVSTGFQVSTATTPVACLLAARRVWAWSYTLSGTSNGAAFTICAAGLITTSSSATNFSGQQAYQVLAINGTRQVTIGADLSPSGASTLQNVIGLGGTSLDGADNVVLTSGPYLTSGGLTLQLDGDALFPAGSSSTTYVTVQLSGGAVVEKGGVAASATSSNSGFVLASSRRC